MATLPVGASAGGLPNVGQSSAITWITSWIAILLMVVLLANTRWGKPIVYYVLWLALALLILGHASDLAALINPGGQSNAGTTNTG